MKYPFHIAAAVVSVASLILCGCAVSSKVTDFNSKTTYVNSMYLDDPGTLRVHDGNAVRELRLDKIKSLKISADVSKMFDRETYYLAEIVFKDGTIIGSFDEKRAKAYVAVNRSLYGDAQGSEYRIMLNDVSKIDFGIR